MPSRSPPPVSTGPALDSPSRVRSQRDIRQILLLISKLRPGFYRAAILAIDNRRMDHAGLARLVRAISSIRATGHTDGRGVRHLRAVASCEAEKPVLRSALARAIRWLAMQFTRCGIAAHACEPAFSLSRSRVRVGGKSPEGVSVQIAVEQSSASSSSRAAGCSFMGASRAAASRQPFDVRPRPRAAGLREGRRLRRGSEGGAVVSGKEAGRVHESPACPSGAPSLSSGPVLSSRGPCAV